MADLGWYIAAGTLGVAGIIMLVRGLFRDRARGQARCPKCWYDLSAQAQRAALTCPECGYKAKRHCHLYRTRRRALPAVAGVVLLAGAIVVGGVPTVRTQGWTTFAPTTLLILMMPSIDNRDDPVRVELVFRVWNVQPAFAEKKIEELWGWQRWLMAHRCSDALEDEQTPPAAIDLSLTLLQALGADGEPAVPALRKVLTSRDQRRLYEAVSAVEAIGPGAASATPELNPFVLSELSLRRSAHLALRKLGHKPAELPCTVFREHRNGADLGPDVRHRIFAAPRADRFDLLEAGMKPREVIEAIGAPDFIRHGIAAWEYDMDTTDPYTLRIYWKDRRTLDRTEVIRPPSWQHGERRYHDLLD